MSAPDRIGIAIDPTTNDLFLRPNGELAVVTNAEAVGQHARQRLGTFEGEWFLDTTAGVPWLVDILGQAYDPALAEAVVKDELLKTDGIEAITNFAISFTKPRRELLIRSISLTTDYDQEILL